MHLASALLGGELELRAVVGVDHRSDETSRGAGNDTSGGNVALHEAVRADHHLISDRHSGPDDALGADVAAVADGYRRRVSFRLSSTE